MNISKHWKKLHKWQAAARKRIDKKVKSIKNTFRAKTALAIAYIKFYRKYYLLAVRNRIISWLRKWVLNFRGFSIAYFLFLVLISLVTGQFITVNPTAFRPDALTYFIGVAAMVGGIIALIYPFKILIMQHAAENTSAGFYRTLGKDYRQDIVLFIMILSAIFFTILAVTATSHQFTLFTQKYDILKILLQLSIFIVGFDFYLVFLLFEFLFKRTDPFTGIALIQKSSLDFLDDIKRRADQYTELMQLHPKTDKNVTKEELLASTFQSFNNDLQYLSNRLNYLFDYHDKVLAKNERTASLTILDTITSILNKYFIIRKDSSFLLPSGFYFVSFSDSQSFLTTHIESLVSVGEKYLKKEDSVGIRKTITIFQNLVSYAIEIKFVGSRTPENPILMQLRGYLDQFMNSLMQKRSLEGMFQGAIAYKYIGTLVLRKKMLNEFSPVFEMLNKIAYAALLQRQDVVVSEVIKSYTALVTVIMEDDWLISEKLDFLLDRLQETVLYAYLSHNSRSIPHGRMQQELAEPYQQLANLVIQKARAVPTMRNARNKHRAKYLIIESVEKLRKSIRYLADNIKNADSLLVGELAGVTRRVGSTLISLIENEHWVDDRRSLEREARAYVWLLVWFTESAEKIDDSMSFDEIPEAIARMGLVALESNQDTILDEAIKEVSRVANTMLIKEDPPGTGHTEPSIMVLACYLGIYALKQGKTRTVASLKAFIIEFERAYQAKHFADPRADLVSSPRRNQLMLEVVQFRDAISDLNRVENPLAGTKEYILRKVTEEDVNNFIREIWNVEVS